MLLTRLSSIFYLFGLIVGIEKELKAGWQTVYSHILVAIGKPQVCEKCKHPWG